LPWRALPGEKPDPYHVWLSEVMLQQTTVGAVGPYYAAFLNRWPTLQDLAQAKLDEVLQMWAGLGYYRRARGLHACAKVLVERFNGVFPREDKDLRSLPGLGPYTAAALRAIAFDLRANVVDGNVERVMARLYTVETPLPKAKKELTTLAESLLPSARYGDYAQALMDLGATVCTPQSPKCDLCPWKAICQARAAGDPASWPRRTKPKAKPLRRGVAFVAFKPSGAVFLRTRPETGLLAGMTEVPSTDWTEGPMPIWPSTVKKAPFAGKWALLPEHVHHTFTHFDLELAVAVLLASARTGQGRWVKPEDLGSQALPSVMRKILRRAYAWRNKEKVS